MTDWSAGYSGTKLVPETDEICESCTRPKECYASQTCPCKCGYEIGYCPGCGEDLPPRTILSTTEATGKCLNCGCEVHKPWVRCEDCEKVWATSSLDHCYVIPTEGAGQQARVSLDQRDGVVELLQLQVRGMQTTAQVKLTYRQAVRLAQKLLYLASKTSEAEE